MTSQDIKEKTFEKAVFGGYDMAEVDDFLEEVAEGFTAMQKENAVLKGKLKVLVEKVEEYRSTEDAMRLALLSAQKMSVQIENEAKEKARSMTEESEKNSAELMTAAKAEADRLLYEAQNAVNNEKAKIEAAKQATANFVSQLREAYTRQLSMLNELQDMKLPPAEQQAQPDIRDTVRSIESSVAKAVESPEEAAPAIDIGSVREAQGAHIPPVDEPTRLYNSSAAGEATISSTPQFDFETMSFND